MEINTPIGDPHRPWWQKFRDSGRGILVGIKGGNSFSVHLFFSAAVVVAAIVLRVDRIEWCLLMLCISTVLTAEYLNSGLEALAKSITRERNPFIRDALDMGSGAVLVMSLGAVFVGLVIFIPRLIELASSLNPGTN